MAMWAMIGSAALQGLSTVMASEQQRMQQLSQADALHSQADAQRQQAELLQQKGDVEARQLERQKRQLRREFEQAQGHNRSLLAAGNVDMSSGSAQDVSLGNIDRFASQLQENAYDVALKNWETAEQAKMANYQADVYDAQGSYLKDTSGNLLTSLLKGGLSAGTSLLGSMAMSSMFNGAGSGAASGAGSGAGKSLNWDRALGQYTKSNPIH